MRIVHLDAAREWRGGQTQLLLLARALRGRVEQHVLLPEHAALRAALVAAEIPVGALSTLRSHRPDLLVAHTPRAHTVALVAGRAPVVVHRRVDFPPRFVWKYRRVRGFVAVSDAVAAVLARAGVAPDRVHVVRDGVDPARWTREAGPDPGIPRPWVLAVGALVPHKGHVHLVDALAELPGTRAVVLGEGPMRQTLRARARALGVADRLHLVGAVADPRGWYVAADAVVHPSVGEGLGQAVLEALLCGARVVGTDAGGVAEILAGRGRIVRAGDARALAVGIRAALAGAWSPPAREALVAPLGAERMANETLAAWTALLRLPAAR